MIDRKKNHMYSSKRKFAHGSGFVDSLSNTLRGIGSYVFQNKDLIAKPMLGAVGQLGAFALTEGVKRALQKKAAASNSVHNQQAIQSNKLDPKYIQILENYISNNTPVSNILGSGIKRI